MGRYEVILDGQLYPVATDLSLRDAENIDIATRASAEIRAAGSKSSHIRQNPAQDDVVAIELAIGRILGSVPSTKKEALKAADKKNKSEIANLYDRLAVARVKAFSVSLANSIAATLDTRYDALVNANVTAQLISARYHDFDISGSARFADLPAKDQDYILNLMLSLDVFFDISDKSNIADFAVESYVNTLAMFQGRKVITRVMTLLSGCMREDAPRSHVHYAAPYLHAVYLGSKVDPSLTWIAEPSADLSLESPFQIFVGNSDNVGLDAESVESICALLQMNTLVSQGVKLALTLALQKKDSHLFFESDTVKDIVIQANLVSAEDFERVRNKSYIIALCAIAISSAAAFDVIIANNFGAVKSAESALKGILQLVGGVSSTPATALRYANAETLEGEFDNYFHWCAALIGAYTESKSFNSEDWSSSRNRLAQVLDNRDLRAKVSALISEIRKDRESGGSVIPQIQRLPFSCTPLDQDFKIGMSGLDYGQRTPISSEFRDYCQNNGHREAFDLVFPKLEFSYRDAVQVLFAGSLLVKSFARVDTQEVKFKLLGGLDSGTPVYKSKALNPLCLVMGHDDFWNCCYTLWREATSSATAAYFTDFAGGICGFAKGVSNYKNYDVITTHFTSYEAVAISYDVDSVPAEGMDLHKGAVSMQLVQTGNQVTDLLSSSISSDVMAIALGGSEMGKCIQEGSFSKESARMCAERFVDAILGATSITRRLSTIGVEDLKEYFSEKLAYADDFEIECEIVEFDTVEEIYSEVDMDAPPSAAMCGYAAVIDASNNFSKVVVAFDREGGDARVTYFDLRGNHVVDVDVDWMTLRYFFSFPKGQSFIPFRGSVHFETSVSNRDVCEELILPSWFADADRKPLVRGGRALRRKDLIRMRTPKQGVFISGDRVL